MEQIFSGNSYEAPIVEVVEVEVEKGFAASNESWEEGDTIPLD